MLWWIVAAAALLGGAFVLVTLPAGGAAALTGHVVWISALVLATGMMLFSRRRQTPVGGPAADGADFAGYPEGHTLAVFESRSDADAALRELVAAQLGHGEARLLAGATAAAELDSEGRVHGATSVAERTLEHLASDEDHLAQYEEAVREGNSIVDVPVAEDERERAHAILRRHGGSQIDHFGRWVVERVDAAH